MEEQKEKRVSASAEPPKFFGMCCNTCAHSGQKEVITTNGVDGNGTVVVAATPAVVKKKEKEPEREGTGTGAGTPSASPGGHRGPSPRRDSIDVSPSRRRASVGKAGAIVSESSAGSTSNAAGPPSNAAAKEADKTKPKSKAKSKAKKTPSDSG